MWFYLKYTVPTRMSSNLFSCVIFQEESSTGFQRTSVTWTLCSHGRLWTLSRWVSPRQVWSLVLQHGKAISCLAKPALWSGSPNLETITVGLPASAAQRLHRFNKSVHIGWGCGSLSVTQQKQHLQRMCLETKQVIGREKGTKEEMKATGWWVRCGGKQRGGGWQGWCVEWQREGVWTAGVRCVCRSGDGSVVEGEGDRSVGTDPERDLPLSVQSP